MEEITKTCAYCGQEFTTTDKQKSTVIANADTKHCCFEAKSGEQEKKLKKLRHVHFVARNLM